MTMREAVDAFIPDGASVAMGVALEAAIPFAAGHEIIRRQNKEVVQVELQQMRLITTADVSAKGL